MPRGRPRSCSATSPRGASPRWWAAWEPMAPPAAWPTWWPRPGGSKPKGSPPASTPVPTRCRSTTLTGSILDDLVLIDKIVGVGEIAVSDHRSSQPTFDELARIAAAARVGGMLSGKAGIVNVHMGDGERMLSLIERILAETEIPAKHFVPTHVNRNNQLFAAAIVYAKQDDGTGRYIDLTTSSVPEDAEPFLRRGPAATPGGGGRHRLHQLQLGRAGQPAPVQRGPGVRRPGRGEDRHPLRGGPEGRPGPWASAGRWPSR